MQATRRYNDRKSKNEEEGREKERGAEEERRGWRNGIKGRRGRRGEWKKEKKEEDFCQGRKTESGAVGGARVSKNAV